MTEGRYELKYMVREENVPELLALAEAHVQADPHAKPLPSGGRGYVVSSLYLDDIHLTGYTERLRMDRIRNRVRVRTYGRAPGDRAPVFLEAKRKLDNQVIKHRIYAGNSDDWLDYGDRPWQRAVPLLEGHQRRRGERWMRHVDSMHMVPVCTVRYEREIFIEGTARLTLDRIIRAAAQPPAWNLFVEAPVVLVPEPWVVLELKFNGDMPVWMRQIVRAMKLRAEPVSKFGLGVVLGMRRDHRHEVDQLVPHSVRRGAA